MLLLQKLETWDALEKRAGRPLEAAKLPLELYHTVGLTAQFILEIRKLELTASTAGFKTNLNPHATSISQKTPTGRLAMRKPAELRFALLFIISVLTLATAQQLASAEGAAPNPAKTGLTPEGHLQLHADDTCPVCAMRPAKRPKFAAAIELTDERTYYFCGNGCMIRAWLHPRELLGAAPEQRLRPVVQEFFTGRPMDARQVIWVAGSDLMGPMGPAIVALENREMAKVFRKRHGGKFEFTLSEMSEALWKQIKGR
jgi:nitrous oxide reductase accessory protein NosL